MWFSQMKNMTRAYWHKSPEWKDLSSELLLWIYDALLKWPSANRWHWAIIQYNYCYTIQLLLFNAIIVIQYNYWCGIALLLKFGSAHECTTMVQSNCERRTCYKSLHCNYLIRRGFESYSAPLNVSAPNNQELCPLMIIYTYIAILMFLWRHTELPLEYNLRNLSFVWHPSRTTGSI